MPMQVLQRTTYAHTHPQTIADRRRLRELFISRRAHRLSARVWLAMAANPAARRRLGKTAICRARARRLAGQHVVITAGGLVNTGSLWEIHVAANSLGHLLIDPEAGAVRAHFEGRVITAETFTAYAQEFNLGRAPDAHEQACLDLGLLVADGAEVPDDRLHVTTPEADVPQ